MLFVGSLIYQKNPQLAVEGAAIARRTRPELMLLVAGEGVLRPELDARAGRRHADSWATGRDVEVLYAAADVLLNTSRWEGLSLALLEGLWRGLPLVVTDGPGNEEAAGDAGLVTRQDPDAVAAALVRLAEDGTLRRTLAERARPRALSRFREDAMLERTLAALRLGRRPQPRGYRPLTEPPTTLLDDRHALPSAAWARRRPGRSRRRPRAGVQLARQGVAEVVCTPHLSRRYPVEHTQATAALKKLRADIEREGIPLRLHLAAEVTPERVVQETPDPPAVSGDRAAGSCSSRSSSRHRSRRSALVQTTLAQHRLTDRLRPPGALPRGAAPTRGAAGAPRRRGTRPDRRSQPARALGTRGERDRLGAHRSGPRRPDRKRCARRPAPTPPPSRCRRARRGALR